LPGGRAFAVRPELLEPLSPLEPFDDPEDDFVDPEDRVGALPDPRVDGPSISSMMPSDPRADPSRVYPRPLMSRPCGTSSRTTITGRL
jgi:hypothetical protein